jgi:hypothetical protein
MRRWTALLLTLALVLTIGEAPARAISSPSGIDPRLRLEWEATRTKAGLPAIAGYIYNDYGRAAMNVRLLAEALDPSGQVVDRSIGLIPGIVPVSNRSTFWVPLKVAGSSYRITVTSFEWRDCGI